ncbi:bifunctional phosphoribosylaminoimidazolecarboxamide formyltransferase/IMP cyclohydrolase [Aggregatilinea lenta]|uniref:bifunctional phosphoribosylaminoimidazolecarboxamide formyltransferase/IMP cyclohydrolase n=1 Tax=Aggregatilinea lenta TaxID=913108 RepID=UPI000E5A62DF|nr:bifunctional phosphoribosylaminoimidazolecarboxamide formyltransferase/IMP cyclohydrolase [Aggregatilinea lenta]
MPRAILSVYDKVGLPEFAEELSELGWELVASGGTARVLELAGLDVIPVEDVTQAPEMLGGRVKTLHPAVHAAILARGTTEDIETLSGFGYTPIDMVVCNLYPFQETIAKVGVSLDEAIEQIDIGGVALLRAAAKNYQRVITIADADDYGVVLAQLQEAGAVELHVRRRLAAKAFALTRDYDTAIQSYLSQEISIGAERGLPDVMTVGLTRVQSLRYGENPHQAAGLYATPPSVKPLGADVLGGKELSYNNLLDLDAAWRAVLSFDPPTVVIVKHLTPTGIATGETLAAAFPLALMSDSVSAFGGVIAVNAVVDDTFVDALGTLFVEAIVAPDYTPSALEHLAASRKNCRLLRIEPRTVEAALDVRSIRDGYLIQTVDEGDPSEKEWHVVTQRQPTPQELQALRFGWKAVQHVKSNAIVLATEYATVGIGGGLPSRLDAARLAVEKAGSHAQGAVMASDAFFPFPDALEVGIQAGVTAVVQPGGSIRDQGVIEAADAAGVAMVFTGTRHFRH